MSNRTLVCRGFAVLLSICITWFLVLLLDRRPVVILDPKLASVSPNPAKPGDTITMAWTADVRRLGCSGEVIQRLIDSSGRVYQYAASSTAYRRTVLKNPGEYGRTLELPRVMAVGPARYEAVVFRWCNVVQQYIWPMMDLSIPFYFVVED